MLSIISQKDEYLHPSDSSTSELKSSLQLPWSARSSMIKTAEHILKATEGDMSEYGELLTQFNLDIEKRLAREQRLQQLASGPSAEQLELHARIKAAIEHRDQEIDRNEEEFQSVVQEVTDHFQSELGHLRNSHESVIGSVKAEANQEIEQLTRQREDSEWVVTSVLDDTAEDSPLREFEKYQAVLEKTQAEQENLLEVLNRNASESCEKFNLELRETAPAERPLKNKKVANEQFHSAFENSENLLAQIRSVKLPKLFLGFRGLCVFITLAISISIPVYLFVDPSLAGITGTRLQGSWIGISAGGGAVAGLLMTLILYSLGAMRLSDLFRQFEQSKADAEWIHQRWLKVAEQDRQKHEKQSALKQKKIEQERDQALDRYEATLTAKKEEVEAERETRIKNETDRYELDRNQAILQRESQLQRLHSENDRRVNETNTRWTSEIGRLEQELKELQSIQSRQYSEKWMQLKSNWEEASQAFFSTVSSNQTLDRQNNQAWTELAQGEWEPPQTMPKGIRHGHLNIKLQNWSGAISTDVRLEPRTTTFEVPGEVTFPGQASTLFQSPNHHSRTQAINALQTMMLRLLLQIPPGKLRFTMIDPINLGESFGGFMHLADYDELMVTNRIWTESGQIEARLADLTEHMENVFQTYLRNEFQTIEEYNESAGEVAEPYHFLVISDFPAKFSEIAARRLTSIINSGPRCGVYTLMNMDPTKPLPNNFELSDIQPHMTTYMWQDDSFHSTEEILSPWPITIESPPEPQEFTSIVHMVGDASKDARKVEVSFNRIAPPKNEIWTHDSRDELEIPLGRAGATKLQTMRLGKGTSQHMLIAGKTGSGKSTFLHILVTNLALHYGPDEVNFFLIDFKKGVEFKDYATCRLPHAQVIAIESDREFGVSALQRLDEVLQERGELFRKHGVQDIAGYRNANPESPLPRILLIVDEFQEFFIEDDKLSQSAAQLLDRLVRQGRAFGVHVILGSQTLGGAYSLARTTLGQVAVRVALQCSEADAHLILSEENTAARLLTRPGEAIYNDANGMAEGNHPFQIGWLSDQERRDYLQQMNEKIKRDGIRTNSPIVFEGNIPSEIDFNRDLKELEEGFSTRKAPTSAPEIWLGDAVEIQPATSLKFHQQSGSHLLIVGQDAEAATGMMASAAIMLSAAGFPQQQKPSIYILDGNPLETEEAKYWKTLSETLPAPIIHSSPRETASVMNELSKELTNRTEKPDEKHQHIFVFVHNIAKFRDLRKSEDDYGMGSFGSSTEEKPADPGKQFATLLKDGPLYGIHFIIWCDSYNNVDRCFSRQTMKELEMRVALQMNPADSSNLIDTPAASRLGTHRALLYREETGLTEKFRPYGAPKQAWIEKFSQTLLHGKTSEFATDLEEFSIL
jgi:DNA segregation ATPase FtsK/SpoIIIE, S-DNA-T family